MTDEMKSMTREELLQLIADARKQIANAERAIARLDLQRRHEARRAAEAAAREYGFELAELLADPAPESRARRRAKPKAEARYRNPADPRQTWTGYGRKPNWIKAALAEGRDLAEFAA